MTNSDTPPQKYHSGIRLKKLRELQGLSITELATELKISSSELEIWEHDGIPSNDIQKCRYYFEVSDLLFSTQIHNQTELSQLVQYHLFPQESKRLQELLDDNQLNHSESLNLSSLNLSEIPEVVFEFTWLKELIVSDNKLKQISSRIILLNQLEILDIKNNFLDSIPGSIFSLEKLQKLEFHDNPLLLQTTLLESDMSLEAFQNYLMGTKITIAILELLTPTSLKHLDDARYIVEQTQSLVITKLDNYENLVIQYKNISCLLYIAENHASEQLAINIKPLFQQVTSPLIILFTNTITNKEQLLIDSNLLRLLSNKTLFIKLIYNIDEFSKSFLDIQQRINYQKHLPIIKFERLILNHIGVYEYLDVKFNSELTVLIGLNGMGKTTILKALTLAVLGPEQAELNENTISTLLRIEGKYNNKTNWFPKGSIQLFANINGKSHENVIYLAYNSNTEKVEVKGSCFIQLFNTDGNLHSLMLGIGEQRNTNLKKSQSLGLEIAQPKVRDLLPIISGEEQACITHFTSWLGNLALSVSQGEMDKQQSIDVSFEIFSSLMQESIQFAGLTKVDPLELWIKHQNPEQIVPIQLASQGYQAIMGWVGYIIQRMFEAYADTIQPLQQHSVIIIDEIDQLLHVKWQHKIINVLAKQFFPNTQWIITTHSPMVVSGLDQEQVLQLHQRDGKLVADPNSVDLWLWQYGDIVRYLFEVSPEKPKEQEQLLMQKIELIKALPQSDITSKHEEELEKLESQLERVQKSRAFIDELYAEQKKLQAKEQELTKLIEQLSQQHKS